MSVSVLVDPTLIRKALNFAGEALRDQKVLGEIMIHSGTIFLLRYSWSDDGDRIEVDISLDGRNGLIFQACEQAGRSAGLPDRWPERLLTRLCVGGVSREGGFPTGMYPTWERPGLRVLAAPPHLLIPMVFLATLRPMRDMTVDDMEPAIRIAAAVGIRSRHRLKRLVMPYLDQTKRDSSDLEREVERKLWLFEEALERFGLGPPLKDSPASLAEVADLIRGNPDWYQFAMYRFEGRFYDEKSNEIRQAMLDPAPAPTGDVRNDAWIGAVGEHLAQRWDLKVPPWTQEAAFMGETVPHFGSCEPIARDIEIVETPPAFRRRLLFSSAEPLMSAKFPHHMKVRMPFWK